MRLATLKMILWVVTKTRLLWFNYDTLDNMEREFCRVEEIMSRIAHGIGRTLFRILHGKGAQFPQSPIDPCPPSSHQSEHVPAKLVVTRAAKRAELILRVCVSTGRT